MSVTLGQKVINKVSSAEEETNKAIAQLESEVLWLLEETQTGLNGLLEITGDGLTIAEETLESTQRKGADVFSSLRDKLTTLLEPYFIERTYSCEAEEWQQAFLEQAKQDLSAANVVGAADGHESVAVMLLQMSIEKLGKAIGVKRKGVKWLSDSDRSHKSGFKEMERLFSDMVRANKGGGLNAEKKKLLKLWKKVRYSFEQITLAHPQHANDGEPRLEYPTECNTEKGKAVKHPREVQVVKELFGGGVRIGNSVIRWKNAFAATEHFIKNFDGL